MKFNPTNYPIVAPQPTDTVLIRRASDGAIRSAYASSIAQASASTLTTETIALLKAVEVEDLTNNSLAFVAGYYSAGDGGGGEFYYSAFSAATDNGGTIIAPTAGTGRWIRVYSGAVNVRWFGAAGDGATNDLAAFDAANDVGSLYIPNGTYRIEMTTIGSQMTITAGRQWMGESRGGTIIRLYNTAGLYINFLNVNGNDVCLRDFSVENYCTGVLSSMFQIQDGHDFVMSNLAVDGRYSSGARIYLLALFDDVQADRGLITGCDFRGVEIAVWTQTTLAVTISDWRFQGNTWAGNYGSCLELHTALTGTTTGWRNPVIVGNVFGAPGTSASIYSLGSISMANVSGAVITGNSFHDHDTVLDQYSAQAVHMENNCRNTTIDGNSFFKCKNPIVLAGQSYETTISGNTFIYADAAVTTASGLTYKPCAIASFDEPADGLSLVGNVISNYENGTSINVTARKCQAKDNVIRGCYIGSIGTHGTEWAGNVYHTCVFAQNVYSTLTTTNLQVGHNTYDTCTNLFSQSAGQRVYFPKGFTIRGTTEVVVASASSYFNPIADPAVLYGIASVELNAVDATGNSLSAGSLLSQVTSTLVQTGLVTSANAGITATGHTSSGGFTRFTFTNTGVTDRAFDYIWTLQGGITMAF